MVCLFHPGGLSGELQRVAHVIGVGDHLVALVMMAEDDEALPHFPFPILDDFPGFVLRHDGLSKVSDMSRAFTECVMSPTET